MDLHKLLLRQLARVELDENTLPKDSKQWQDLLARINKSYIEGDQERYMLERSMEISSRELHELNDKLMNAQHIARMGYWYTNVTTGKTIWSKELLNMLGISVGTKLPNLNDALKTLIHEEDRPELEKLIARALSEGKSYETEVRIKSQNGLYRWYLVVGQPHTLEKNIHELSGIAMDITHRKEVEKEVDSLHQQLISSARRAGMADVATAVLHNIGNVLTSVNVSLGLINENIHQQTFDKLNDVEKLLSDHKDNLSVYLTQDTKGKLIPNYISILIKNLSETQHVIINEIKNLNDHIQHIKEITAMQGPISGMYGIIEKVNVTEVIESSLKMSGWDEDNNKINIIKKLANFIITTDKAKLQQVVINLILNASDALIDVDDNEKTICLTVNESSVKDMVEIKVQDNGIGIEPDNLTKIFSFGFTTKKSGHGFGLHSSALIAKELGGMLKAYSDGKGKGATFILTLPLAAPSRRKYNDKKTKLTNHSH